MNILIFINCFFFFYYFRGKMEWENKLANSDRTHCTHSRGVDPQARVRVRDAVTSYIVMCVGGMGCE